MPSNHLWCYPAFGACNAGPLRKRSLANVHLLAQSKVRDQGSNAVLVVGQADQNILRFYVSVHNVEMVKMTQSIRGLVQNFFDADELLELRWIFALDVVLKSRRAQFDCDVAELAVTLGAEIPNDILVRVGLPKQADLSISQSETFGQQSLHSNFALLERAFEYKRALAAFPQHVPGVERYLSNLYQLIYNRELKNVN